MSSTAYITTSTPAVAELIARLRLIDPATLAPEVYGLSRALRPEPATTVIALCGFAANYPERSHQTWDQACRAWKQIDFRPEPTETLAAWNNRTIAHMLLPSIEDSSAYSQIGFDWVSGQFNDLPSDAISFGALLPAVRDGSFTPSRALIALARTVNTPDAQRFAAISIPAEV